jgi:hypothetical protein
MKYTKINRNGVIYYIRREVMTGCNASGLNSLMLLNISEVAIDTNDNTILKSRTPVEKLVDAFVDSSDELQCSLPYANEIRGTADKVKQEAAEKWVKETYLKYQTIFDEVVKQAKKGHTKLEDSLILTDVDQFSYLCITLGYKVDLIKSTKQHEYWVTISW